MNPRLQRAQDLLRRVHLLTTVDRLRLSMRTMRSRRRNRELESSFPDFALPPRHLAFDAYGVVDWSWYKDSGESMAREIVDLLSRHAMSSPTSLLDWGCGPARIVRHLPGLLPGTQVYGSDYNRQTVDWCAAHIPRVRFVANGLHPPLPFEDGELECIYGISVVTHLSQDVAESWLAELARVLTPGGLLVLWTNGDAIAAVMLPEERDAYEEGRYVSRAGVKEGIKWFLSLHPDAWVRGQLSRRFDVEEHLPGGFTGTEQDIWVARKR